MTFNSPDAMTKFFDEVEKSQPIDGGFKCHLCGREIRMKKRGENQRGVGFMKISLISHMKAHRRKGDF